MKKFFYIILISVLALAGCTKQGPVRTVFNMTEADLCGMRFVNDHGVMVEHVTFYTMQAENGHRFVGYTQESPGVWTKSTEYGTWYLDENGLIVVDHPTLEWVEWWNAFNQAQRRLYVKTRWEPEPSMFYQDDHYDEATDYEHNPVYVKERYEFIKEHF